MPTPVHTASAWRLYVYVLAPAITVVALLSAMFVVSVMVMGGSRAYVGGESLWSKARSRAVQYLNGYAASKDPRDYASFEQALQVPLGDRRAREAMSKPELDIEAVRDGFREGGNHPEDIDAMITLFRRFGHLALFRESVDAWTTGDELIAQLRQKAIVLHRQIELGANDAAIRTTMREVQSLNERLFEAEIRFSANLAEAARVTERLLLGSTMVSALLLSMLGYLTMRQGLRRQHDAQQSLANANRRWELASVCAGLGVFELDSEGRRIHLDANAAALYGLPAQPTKLKGLQFLENIVPEDRLKASQTLAHAVATHAIFRVTLRTMLAGGQIRHLETVGNQAESENGEPKRYIGVVRDVTQEVARAQMAMERDAAERVATSQRNFLSRLSHELRTPLNAILGFAQLLSIDRQQPLPPNQSRQVEWILDAGHQLLKLIEDVLDLSKVESGEIHIEPMHVELAPVLQASLVLIGPASQRYQVSIVDRVPRDLPAMQADPSRLQQVLVNLLTNGCKFNKPGGRVTIDAHAEEQQVRIEVSDTGIGLTPEDAAELFQPFRRVAAVASRIEGTGLGLYIVRQLVERMGGSVSVRSEPGEGSCFTVRLPRAV